MYAYSITEGPETESHHADSLNRAFYKGNLVLSSHTHTHTTVISLFIRAATAMGSGHRFSFLMQHCNNHKFAHQLTFYCPAWTVDLDLNSFSLCVCSRVCFRGSVINTSLRVEVSKALYQKLILLSAKALTRNTKPKCPSHFPSSSSQTHINTNSPTPHPHHLLNAASTLKHTLFLLLTSLQNQYCWKLLRLEVFKLPRLSCPKTITAIKEKHPWNKDCCYWTSARHVLLRVEKTSSLTNVFHLGLKDDHCSYY